MKACGEHGWRTGEAEFCFEHIKCEMLNGDVCRQLAECGTWVKGVD